MWDEYDDEMSREAFRAQTTAFFERLDADRRQRLREGCVTVPAEVPLWEREEMRKRNQRRWNFCVFCHRRAETIPYRIPLRHKMAFIGPENEDLPIYPPADCIMDVSIPVCTACKHNIFSFLRTARTSIVLLSWLVGWHYSWHEVNRMPAHALVKHLAFLMRNVPDYIDTYALTS